MTGISQCAESNDYSAAASPLDAGARTSCLLDPRYLTWRMMTVRLLYNGATSWTRVDSYWDTASHVVGSSWGPSIRLSTHEWSGADNNGSTDLGKTYVFALGDGSGVALNHLSFSTVQPTTNTATGSGTNALSNTSTIYTTAYPNLYEDQFCSTSTLLLTGTEDVGTLADVITASSDGYQASLSMSLETFFAGARTAWRGVCLVYYASELVADNSGGALCHVVVRDDAATAGLTDFGQSALVHIMPGNWSPPATSANIVPANLAITSAAYGVVHEPAIPIQYLLSYGFYSTLSWYQPKKAAYYSSIRRYSKSESIAAYCM